MNSKRVLLEVFKFVSPADVLESLSVTCAHWNAVTEEEELWREFLEIEAIDMMPDTSAKRSLYLAMRNLTLVSITKQAIQVVKLRRGTSTVLQLKGKFQMSWNSSYALIAKKKVVVCGSQSHQINPEVYEVDYSTGAVRQLANMKVPRVGHGLIALEDQVYAFGGLGQYKSSEKMSLSANQWSILPEMCEGHAWFNPCADSDFVYICGGRTRVCERFDLKRERFSLLRFTLPSEGGACVTLKEQCLIVLQPYGSLTVLHLRTKEVNSFRVNATDDVWPNTNPIIFKQALYRVRIDREHPFYEVVLPSLL